jgi:hypothetical protein
MTACWTLSRPYLFVHFRLRIVEKIEVAPWLKASEDANENFNLIAIFIIVHNIQGRYQLRLVFGEPYA